MKKILSIIICFFLVFSFIIKKDFVNAESDGAFSVVGGVRLGSSVKEARKKLNMKQSKYEFKDFSSSKAEAITAESYGIFNPNFFYLPSVNICGYDGSCHLYLDDDDKVSYALYSIIVGENSLLNNDPEKQFEVIEEELIKKYGEAPYSRKKLRKLMYLPVSFEPQNTKIYGSYNSYTTNTYTIYDYTERVIDINDKEEVIIQHYFFLDESKFHVNENKKNGTAINFYYNNVGFIFRDKQQNDSSQ